MVHFDLHPDTWQTEFGGRWDSHGTPVRRALEWNVTDPARRTPVGRRGQEIVDPDGEAEGMARGIGMVPG